MSQYEDYADDEDLADFIVVDDDAPAMGETGEMRAPESTNSAEITEIQENPETEAMHKIRQLSTNAQGGVPETARLLRAHISILVSALGGPDHSSEKNEYKLGHDALACLKDLKRWLRAVDEKNGTFAVALACADCDLVKNDLTVILCQWDKPSNPSRTIEKVRLACLELLVLLTWPTDVNKNTLLKDYAEKTSTRRAQLVYKHHILSYRQGKTLKAVLRLGLGALRVPHDEREPRDTAILRLVLFFIRNVLYIEPLPVTKGPKAVANGNPLPRGIGADEIALPAVISAFERNNVLLFLNSVAHSVSGNLNDEAFGLLAMECIALLTRGVRTEELVPFKPNVGEEEDIINNNNNITSVPPASSVAGMGLQDLLGEESRRKRQATNSISTRHGRFGTLLSIRNSSNASYYAVSGQKALASTYDTLQKLDDTKNWHKPSTFKYDSNTYAKKPTVLLGTKSAHTLSQFINQLLASGSFNNLLVFVGRHLTNIANDRDLGRRGILDAIDPTELASYFNTIAWFFRYKRERTQSYQDQSRIPGDDEDGLDYGSVGAALSEVNFILLISYFRSSFEAKDYDSLHVAMVCFREMLLISNTIFNKKRTQQEIDLASEEDINEDRELAEGIIRKLFSQKHFLDMCVNIPKTAAKHSPEYLGVVVSVVHILLKSFESLANEDVHLFIKTRRKMRKIAARANLNQEMDREHLHLIDKGSDEEDNEDEIRYITQERKLDLKNTEVKFFHPDTISTHIEYLSKYEDLSTEEIKRGLSFFHRLFVVRKDFSSLFRLDFMMLLYKLQVYLPRSSPNRRHVDDFIVYFMKKFKPALDRFPMAIELLFPRLENVEMKGYLSTGDLEIHHEVSKKKTTSSDRGKSSYFDETAVQPRAAPLLQFIDDEKSLDEKIGVLVYILSKKKNTTNFLKFFSSELQRIVNAEPPSGDVVMLKLNLGNRRLLISEPHLRLLLETLGFGLPYLQNDETTLHESVSVHSLEEARGLLNKWIDLHEAGVGDIEPFLDQIQRTILSKEQLDFGVASLADIREGKAFDENKAEELALDEKLIHKVIGLAKRREYDENVSSQFYADDDFMEPPSQANSDDEEAPAEKSTKKRRRQSDPEDDFSSSDEEFLDEEKIRKRRERYAESASGMSDSDEEGLALFFTDRRRRRAPHWAKKGFGSKSIPKRAHARKARLVMPSEAFSDDETSKKSAALVHDSDDESDDERNKEFFDKEEKLRQLIASTGGISSKEQLQMFKESWNAILSSKSGDQVNEAVKKASELFVNESDNEEIPTKNILDQPAHALKAIIGPFTDSSESDDDSSESDDDSSRTENLSQNDQSEKKIDADNELQEEDAAESVSRKRRVIIDESDEE